MTEGRADRIMALAKELYPEDGYETPEENDGSSLFQLLCEATRLYSDTAYQPMLGQEVTGIADAEAHEAFVRANDVQTTLDAIGENLIEANA